MIVEFYGFSIIEATVYNTSILVSIFTHEYIQCGPGSFPGLSVKCGLSLLLVIVVAPRGFSPGTDGFPLSSKTNISKFQFDLEFGVLLKGGPRPTLRPAAHFTVRGPWPRPAARAIYIFLRLLQDGGYSTRETGNYQNNTPASQWLAHIGLGHI